MSPVTDTITALATPSGTSAIAVVRISGPETTRLAGELAGGAPPPRTLRRADYRDRAGVTVDDVLWAYFPAPHSYTGEDVLEISSHGNPYIVRRILDDLLARGCRAAEPGEFTQRAFLNGRMDLSEAEAVMDLIHARSERALAAANQQLRGALGRRINVLVERLLAALARVEAYIDFPDEDLPANDRLGLQSDVAALQVETSRLLATRRYGDLLRDGIRTVIVGAPNVGKSSLLNALVGRDRALVSAEPGTTRDFIEERVILGAHCLRLIDTAGLNSAPAALESLGIEKSWERLEEADIVLAVIDLSEPSPTLPESLRARIRPETTIVVGNKQDVMTQAFIQIPVPEGFTFVSVSAVTSEGLEELAAAICEHADTLQPDFGNEYIAINARHAGALERVRAALSAAAEKIQNEAAVELLASDLRAALDGLGEIAGRIDNERVLDQLFATFCIGK